MSSENFTLRFCNHFSIIPSDLARKMSTNYPGIKLLWVDWTREIKNENFFFRSAFTSSTRLQNKSFDVVDWTRMLAQRLQNYCFFNVECSILWCCCLRTVDVLVAYLYKILISVLSSKWFTLSLHTGSSFGQFNSEMFCLIVRSKHAGLGRPFPRSPRSYVLWPRY